MTIGDLIMKLQALDPAMPVVLESLQTLGLRAETKPPVDLTAAAPVGWVLTVDGIGDVLWLGERGGWDDQLIQRNGRAAGLPRSSAVALSPRPTDLRRRTSR